MALTWIRLPAAVTRHPRWGARCRGAAANALAMVSLTVAVPLAAPIPLRWHTAGQGFQISVRRSLLKARHHTLQRIARRHTTIGKAPDHEQRHRERAPTGRAVRESREGGAIDSFAHHFRTRFDFIAGRRRAPARREG